jgi:hypothetical protein
VPFNKIVLIAIGSACLSGFIAVKYFNISSWVVIIAYIGLSALAAAYIDYYRDKVGADKFKDIIYLEFAYIFHTLYFFQLIGKPAIDRINELKSKDKLKNAPKENGKRVIRLEDIKDLWMKKDENPLDIREPAQIERVEIQPHAPKTMPIQDVNPPEPVPADGLIINNPVLRDFIYKENILKLSKTNINMFKVIMGAIEIFDKYGDEASVVDLSSDPDYIRPKTQYDALRTVNLLEHSIDVYTEMTSRHKSNIVKPKMFIAAFFHDVGKMMEFRSGKYVTGKHPDSSYQVLITTDGFTGLKDEVKEDLIQAVRLHHMSPNNEFAKELQEADRKARQKELDRFVQNGGQVVEAVQSTPSAPARIYSKEKIVLEWLDIDMFLSEIKKKINVLTSGRRWDAFSFKDGSVFVQLGAVESILKQFAAHDINANEALLDDGEKRQKVYNWLIDEELRRRGCINEKYVLPGFYGNKFKVYMNDEPLPRDSFFVVFTAQTFGDIEEMEQTRHNTERINEITKIEPIEKKEAL